MIADSKPGQTKVKTGNAVIYFQQCTYALILYCTNSSKSNRLAKLLSRSAFLIVVFYWAWSR